MNSFSNFKKVLWIVQSCIVLVIIVEAFLFCLKWRYSVNLPLERMRVFEILYLLVVRGRPGE